MWQITPVVLYELTTSKDQGLVDCATCAFRNMKKLDVAVIEAAARAL